MVTRYLPGLLGTEIPNPHVGESGELIRGKKTQQWNNYSATV